MILVGGYLISALTVGALWLAWLSRRSRRDRPVWGALLLGTEDQEQEANQADIATDLRFSTFVGAVMILVCGAVLFPALSRGHAAGELVFAAVLALPVMACGLALLADALGRCLPLERRSGGSGRVGDGDSLQTARDVLERAMEEVREVQDEVEDPGHVLALEALGEAVVDYGRALEQSGHVSRTGVCSRIEGVMTLARSVLTEKPRDEDCAETRALAALGLAPSATPLEAERVYRVLRELYTGTGSLPGVDPRHVAELDAAWEHLRRDAEEQEEFQLLTASSGFEAIDLDPRMLTTTAQARRAA